MNIHCDVKKMWYVFAFKENLKMSLKMTKTLYKKGIHTFIFLFEVFLWANIVRKQMQCGHTISISNRHLRSNSNDSSM